MIVTEENTFTGEFPNVKNGVPTVMIPGGNPMTVTTAAPGTRLCTLCSSVMEMEMPRGNPPSVVVNVTALSAASY